MKSRINLAHRVGTPHVGEPYGEVEVRLSRRNLESLLYKLDREGEAMRTLVRLDGMVYLIVIAEENEDHYGDRKPGDMGEDIEEKLAHPTAWPEND